MREVHISEIEWLSLWMGIETRHIGYCDYCKQPMSITKGKKSDVYCDDYYLSKPLESVCPKCMARLRYYKWNMTGQVMIVHEEPI
jgi:hypothetical protein